MQPGSTQGRGAARGINHTPKHQRHGTPIDWVHVPLSLADSARKIPNDKKSGASGFVDQDGGHARACEAGAGALDPWRAAHGVERLALLALIEQPREGVVQALVALGQAAGRQAEGLRQAGAG